MDERDGDWMVQPATRVRPKSIGRGLPVPPVIPLVAILSVLFGLTMGYRLAPGAAPSPTPRHTPPVITPAPTTAPLASGDANWSFLSIIGPIEILDPPEGGMKLDQLLTQLAGPGLRIPASSVLSARVARYNQVSSINTTSDQWVWVLVISGTSEATVPVIDCGVGSVSAQPSSVQACFVGHTTEILILDYMDGGFLEAQSWAIP